ncbi:MAG TPA: tRNA lysidine(34) synthetase TilS [Caulobacteraceae bacterium]|nr:tRNA lysidine(34) synthetase TilS [Caulobacteraceae bacterium]
MRGGLISAPQRFAPLEGLERLNAADRPPVAVAFSGGSDSLALLHLAKAWADSAGRALIGLTVDHGLQPCSAAWSRFAEGRARQLGVAHRILAWRGDKPVTGLPAAARTARHALLAEATRSAGARVILLAHTADDLMEAQIMRQSGTSLPSPRLWSPSPAWPDGRGVFLLRPLLGHRRADLQRWLTDLGETWIDDPANDDPHYSRTLARRRLRDDPVTASAADPLTPPAGWEAIEQGVGGDLNLPRGLLTNRRTEAHRLIGALALCAAGATRPPAAASLDRIADRLAAGDFTASLAGARIEACGDQIRFCREPGERARGGLRPAALPIGDSVFDGRFLLSASQPGHSVAPLHGLAAQLPRPQRGQLKAIPPGVRGGLPVVIAPSGEVSCPILAMNRGVLARPLGLARLQAAMGVVADEQGAVAA